MAEKLDADAIRDTLHRVISYRDLKSRVRSTGSTNFFWGVLFFAIWYSRFGGQVNLDNIVSTIYLSIACLEIGVGLLKWISPIAECFLFDAVILFLFAGLNGFRALVIWNAAQQPDIISIALFLYMGYQGIQCVQAYFALQRAFPDRPSSANIAFVNDLIREIQRSDPDHEEDALELGAGLKGKMLGNLLILADAKGSAFVAERETVEIVVSRTRSAKEGLPIAELRLFGQPHSEFPASESTLRNYMKWKSA